ncbi:MAG: hypothetical protein WAM79_15030 [Candidatus Sulfotelmatobacter sp.]
MLEREAVEIKEAYRDYKPPIPAAKIVHDLLQFVPAKYLIGLDCVVLSNLSGQPRRKRLGKTTSRGRRVAQLRVAGLYHQRWKGQPPWIELYMDQILRRFPRWALWIPLINRLAIGRTLYHEVGHHIHYTVRPEYREEEDVADDWGKRLSRRFLRRRYFYLVPIAKIISLFWRK